jgi:hypothetical protein
MINWVDEKGRTGWSWEIFIFQVIIGVVGMGMTVGLIWSAIKVVRLLF